MANKPPTQLRKPLRRLILIAALTLSSCDISISPVTPAFLSPTEVVLPTASPSAGVTLAPTSSPSPRPSATGRPPSPTPDPPRVRDPHLNALGAGWAAFSYKVRPGEDLGQIGARYGVSIAQMRAANGFAGGEALLPDQVILIPQRIQQIGPSEKLIPDSELVYGPGAVGFDVAAFVAGHPGGYLHAYSEVVNGEALSGAQLVQRAAENFSLNPRLLLALLEYQSGWLSEPEPELNARRYPFGRTEGGTEGLHRQLGWAANALNHGFYNWRNGNLSLLILGDGTRAGLADGLNAGTAALQYFFAQATVDAGQWESTIGPRGFARTYARLFSDPFARAVEPLVPGTLEPPELSLPWQGGETWFYSGGPHASFGPGSPWGAVDFLPPGREAGCGVSSHWVTAVADGVVARSGDGQLLLDLDGDGHEHTGWVILYLHLAADGRPPAGQSLLLGDKVGHPSCEGGFAEDAHIHVARKYNGVWLPVAASLAPFVMGGYTFRSTGSEYNGLIEGFGLAKLACACRDEKNAITK